MQNWIQRSPTQVPFRAIGEKSEEEKNVAIFGQIFAIFAQKNYSPADSIKIFQNHTFWNALTNREQKTSFGL